MSRCITAWIRDALTPMVITGALIACEPVPSLDFDPALGDGGLQDSGISNTSADGGLADGATPDASEQEGKDPVSPDGDGGMKPSETAEPELEPCESEDARRCGKQAGSRDLCVEGVWTPSAACEEGSVCTTSETGEDGACLTVAEICQGSAGETVCDGQGVMIMCGEDGVPSGMTMCPSARHCQLGIASGTCAVCVPEGDDAFACDGEALSRCLEDGTGYAPEDTCETATLCNPVAGACTMSACGADQTICEDDVLKQCNANLTGFDMLDECDQGLCDAATGTCDACVPNAAGCQDDTTALRCSEDGSEQMVVECPGQTPVCVGSGKCVECGRNADCSTSADCRLPYCNRAAGVCEPQLADEGTDCSGGGKCSDEGECVECLSALADCPAVGSCQTRNCTSDGKCAPRNVQAGDTCRGEAGVCDGKGNCVPCLVDDDCPQQFGCMRAHCNTGNNRCEPQVAVGADCGSSGVCNDEGQCVGCLTDGECDAPPCHAANCNSDGVCDPEPHSNGNCNDPSFGSGYCSAGDCVECKNDSHCPGGVCRESDGACVDCTEASDCGTHSNECKKWSCDGYQCVEGNRTDSCTTDSGRVGTCASGECVECIGSDASPCDNAGTCEEDLCFGGRCIVADLRFGDRCPGGYCDNNRRCRPCVEDSNCDPGDYCDDDNTCQDKCGNGVVDTGEQCDYKETELAPFECTDKCTRQTIYTPCNPEGGEPRCLGDTFCVAKGYNFCSPYPLCETHSDCPKVGPADGAGAHPYCGTAGECFMQCLGPDNQPCPFNGICAGGICIF